MQTDLITKVYFNEHLTHSCVGIPQGLQALSSSCICTAYLYFIYDFIYDYLGHDAQVMMRYNMYMSTNNVDGSLKCQQPSL